jgi:hypothetical protein
MTFNGNLDHFILFQKIAQERCDIRPAGPLRVLRKTLAKERTNETSDQRHP